MIKIYLKHKWRPIIIYCNNYIKIYLKLLGDLNKNKVVNIENFSFSGDEYRYAIYKEIRRKK